MVGHAKDTLLVADVLDLLETDDVGYAQDLQGVVLLRGLLPAQAHSPERPGT